jgi:colicin import membrane protein
LEPESFRAALTPLPDRSGKDAMSYPRIVGSLLERVKRYPEAARRRGAKGAAIIKFALDDLGRTVSIALLRSSGDSGLDAESIDLVKRAAPFPAPPPGAKRSFTIEVAFGLGR